MTDLINAVILTGFGGPEKLVYTQIPKPTPKPGEVLIKVGACSVNNTDINTRTGWYAAEDNFQAILQDTKENNPNNTSCWTQNGTDFPRIQGADIVGKVIEIGENVDVEFLQQRVIVDSWIRDETLDDYQYIGSELDGGFAEYVVVPATNIYPINSPLSDIELATFPCAYSTAENMLTKGRIGAEDTVVIMGASGGVGSALIQLSKIRGAKVIAIVGANKETFAKDLGANYIYPRDNSLESNLAQHKITVALDVVGGNHFNLMIKALEPRGRYVSCGAIGNPIVTLDLRDLIYKDLEMIGATRLESDVFQRLVRYLEKGLLKPLVAKVFPLSEIKEAQQFFQTKGFFGKVVLNINKQNITKG
ncbi:alcohol dehydrogenase family protein [Okeania sp. SIO2B3]|uniref:alcohol dehydrogenase family protein n=1 Tax=Okeania sp. SIO2B3 TaxID=2607784 RepID=UPI0013C1BA90|nr:alcohol dehydrogenase family protein [Okeania sp. SIO2B3]NET46656.1 zinc-binding dehydrogenase [Okeania sp. SIO2B3]